MGPAASQTQGYGLRDAKDRGLRRMVTVMLSVRFPLSQRNVVYDRGIATVFELMPDSRLNCASDACDRGLAAVTSGVVVALP